MGWIIRPEALIVLQLLLLLHFSDGLTNPKDVAAINSLYAAFGAPQLPGWVPTGGDPCAEAWQGVQCDNTNIISIILVGANLGGGLGNNLGSFTSIKTIDLSNNHIGGSIPSSLAVSLQAFFLSDNNFTGSIPSSISSLTSLTALKLNDNHITGELPDAFQSLSNLSGIDFARNNLSGELPPSMANLSSLTSLHLQANHLSGKLDVLGNLPLQDLNIENNSFSGPIPEKLLNIPNFRGDGNPFNTSPAPVPSPPAPLTLPSPSSPSMLPSPVSPGTPAQSPPLSDITPPGPEPGKQAASPSSQQEPSNQKKMQSSKTKRIVGMSIGSVLGVIILILAFLLCLPWCFTKSREYYRAVRRHGIQPYMGARETSLNNEPFSQPKNQVQKAGKDTVVAIKDEPRAEVRGTAAVPKPENEPEGYSLRSTLPLRKLDSELGLSDIDIITPPPPPPPPPSSTEKVTMKPIASVGAGAAKPSIRALPLTSVRSFTIASLQQYTNSFSQANLIGSGMLGSIYQAELPDGKLLAVKKLDKGVCSRQKEYEFIELVNDIDRIRHANIVELVGYCSEHGQRLLIYEYCSNGTLHDALHSNDEYRMKLSWNTRMQMALEAARALEYLHEESEPPIVHRNFKSANILLDDELSIRASDCGLAPLIASGAVSQLSGQLISAYGYGAPEFELGVYTEKSDVFSFGVVMLELLTGRMPYDRTRVRGEQFLVRWAVPQLHDIDALQMMVDPSLNEQYMTKSLSFYADIISRCVRPQPEFRPLMSEVVQDLQRLLHMQFEY